MQLKLLVCGRSSANAGNMIIAEPVRTLKFDAYFDRVAWILERIFDFCKVLLFIYVKYFLRSVAFGNAFGSVHF